MPTIAPGDAVAFRQRPEGAVEGAFPRRLAPNITPPYKFAYARTALKYGLKSLGFRRGEALLVPEFVCDVLIEPLEALGVEPQFYPVSVTLEPDWHQLERLVTKRSRALLVVHYFGQPQPVSRCLEFCREHSLLFIEDNAHGFGGTFAGQLLGTFGDAGVSSPRKSFSIPNGAYLHVKNDMKTSMNTLQLEPSALSPRQYYLNAWFKKMPLIEAALNCRARIIEYRRRLEPPKPYGSQEAFRGPPLRDEYGMDESTELFLKRQDIERIRNVRQRIYRLWQQWTSAQGLNPVFPSLAPGAIPLVFPAFADSAASSREWYERGHRAGIDIYSWPTLPQAVVERNGGAMRLWERLLCFPIHQDMRVGLLQKRLAVL